MIKHFDVEMYYIKSVTAVKQKIVNSVQTRTSRISPQNEIWSPSMPVSFCGLCLLQREPPAIYNLKHKKSRFYYIKWPLAVWCSSNIFRFYMFYLSERSRMLLTVTLELFYRFLYVFLNLNYIGYYGSVGFLIFDYFATLNDHVYTRRDNKKGKSIFPSRDEKGVSFCSPVMTFENYISFRKFVGQINYLLSLGIK